MFGRSWRSRQSGSVGRLRFTVILALVTVVMLSTFAASPAPVQAGNARHTAVDAKSGGKRDRDKVQRFQRGVAAANRVVEAQVVGGTPVPNGKYPFMAYLNLETNNGAFACGGSIIDATPYPDRRAPRDGRYRQSTHLH